MAVTVDVVGADSTGFKRTRPDKPLAGLEEKIDRRGFHHYMNGVMMEQTNQLPMAVQEYRRALQSIPDSYEIRYDYARVLFLLRGFQDALAALEMIRPEDAPVWVLRAAAHRSLGQNNEAKDNYLQAVKADSTENATPYSFLAAYYLRYQDLDSAIWARRNLVRIMPEDFRLWQELGKLLVEKVDYKAARDAFDSSIALNSGGENMMSFVQMADIYRLLGHGDSSIVMLRSAHQIEPDNLVLNRLLSAHYIGIDSFAVALPFARVVAVAEPEEEAALRRLGVIYYVIDSLHQADSVFSILTERQPKDETPHYYLGRIAGARGNYQTAQSHFEKVVDLAAQAPEGYLDLAWCYQKLEDSGLELATLEEGLEKCPDSAATIRLLMALGAAQERYLMTTEATESFERLLAMDSSFAPALNYLGYMLADKGERLPYALTLIERAVQSDPDNAAYLDSYGWVHYRLGNMNEAIDHLERAAALDSDPVIFDHLGDAYQAAGQTTKARHWWQRALEDDPNNLDIRKKLTD